MKRQKGVTVRVACVAVVLLAFAAACGGDDDDGSGESSAPTEAASPSEDTGGNSSDDVDADSDGVLRVAVDLTSSGGLRFDPTKMATGQYISSTPVLRSLLVREADGTLVADLAASAEVVDPTTVVAELRPGLTFSDGTPLNAEAVKATFERNLASQNSAGLLISDMALVESITADSATALTIKLKQPSAAVVYALLAGVEFAPISPASFADADAGDGRMVVGAGPLMIESYEPDVAVTMVRNPNYWDADNVTLGGITYVNVQPGPGAVNALRSDAVDYAVVQASQTAELAPPIELSQHTMTAPLLFQWCMQDGSPLGDPRVRQAVVYSLDREAYNQSVYGGTSEVAWGLWPAESPWHDQSLEDGYARNIDKAKSLLAEAGYPDGFSFTMLGTPTVTRDLEVFQGQLAEAGIDMEIIPSNNPLDYYIDKKTDATYSQGRPGPLDKISRHFLSTSFTNACRYPSPEGDALYSQLAALPLEDPEAIELWGQFQELVVRDLAWHPAVTFQQHFVAYNSDTVGELVFYFDQLGGRQPDPVGTTMRPA